MKSVTQLNSGISICNELLRRELAAVEVYSLAGKLLDRELGGPDYNALQEAHRGQAERLKDCVLERGGQPRSGELSWDRPRTAVLCAATLYGSEAPQPQLLSMEETIVEAYRGAADDRSIDPDLRKLISEVLINSADGSRSVLNAWGHTRFVGEEGSLTEMQDMSQSTVA